MNIEKAYLSNEKDIIKFQYGEKIIRFRGPYSLEYFTSVKEWENGFKAVAWTESARICVDAGKGESIIKTV